MHSTARTTFQGLSTELLTRVARGDQTAFRLFYDQSSRILFTLALRILGSREEATELLHELYLDVWRKAIRYDPARATPITWLVTLARSRAVERVQAKSSSSRSTPSGSPVLGGPSSERLTPAFETQMELDRRHAVASALTMLSEIQRQALEWAFFDGLSHGEIAARTGLPADIIDTHVREALAQLKEALLPYLD